MCHNNVSIKELCHRVSPSADHQPCDVSGASQSDRKLVEDMEALREALGVCHVQVDPHPCAFSEFLGQMQRNDSARFSGK